MYELIEFRHLKCFLTVAQEGNVSRAAEILHITQPTVSTAIKQLEDSIPAQLFYRESSGVRLTPAGHSLVADAEQMMKFRDRAFENAQAVDIGTTPPLNLGFSPFIDRALVELAFASHQWLFPDSAIRPTAKCTAQLIDLLIEGSIDAGLVTLPVETQGLIVQPLVTERILVCMRKDDPQACEPSISPRNLSSKLQVSFDPKLHPKLFAQLVSQLSRAGVNVKATHIGATPSDIQWMVKRGMGYALVREGRPLDSDLVMKPISGADVTINSGFIYSAVSRHSELSLLACEMKNRMKNNGGATTSRRLSKSSVSEPVEELRLIS
jgi:DNA-binding transcriptional LysR family regulator